MIRIAVDLTEACSEQKTGCAHYCANAVSALLSLPPTSDEPLSYEFFCRASRWQKRMNLWKPHGHAVRWYQEPLFPLFSRHDIVLGFGSVLPLWRRPAKCVVLFDVFACLDNDLHQASDHFRTRKRSQYFRIAQKCDAVMAISHTTKRDFLAHYDYPEERVFVVYAGVSPQYRPENRNEKQRVLAKYDLPEKYCFFAGALVPRKNITRLIRAFSLSKAGSDHVLAVTGRAHDLPDTARIELKRSGALSKVRFLGYVPDEDMPGLFANAKAFLFPTLYEGFGLPVLEAMASGIPVLTSSVGAAAEIAAGHAILANPLDEEAIARGIDESLAMASSRIDAARRHATAFSWPRCAQKILEVCLWAAHHRR